MEAIVGIMVINHVLFISVLRQTLKFRMLFITRIPILINCVAELWAFLWCSLSSGHLCWYGIHNQNSDSDQMCCRAMGILVMFTFLWTHGINMQNSDSDYIDVEFLTSWYHNRCVVLCIVRPKAAILNPECL